MAKSYRPHERNLRWVSTGVGWFAAQLILEESVGLFSGKKSQIFSKNNCCYIPSPSGGGEARRRQQKCIMHLFLGSNISESFQTIFILRDVYVFVLNVE